ncbi:MAG: lysophospholipid acyltransferase family protein [Pseudomonadota bacterium]
MDTPHSPFATPDDIPDRTRFGAGMEIVRFIAMCMLKVTGWQIAGSIPPVRKLVLIGGPHTSNWDFVMLVLCALHYRAPTNWIGKDALFKPPHGWITRRLGGFAVDRSKANDTVSQVIAEINRRDDMILVITPEGTRGKVTKWKSGFYWIAHGANIPIGIFYADYARRVAGFGPTCEPSGDYEADVVAIKEFMATITPKNPNRIPKSERNPPHA